ncbi:DUF58 domain-containing protein [Alicyclobacillus dauci]|uniref:DUF58 domain-containing protein n=1 Tax=Alicyclobacillus dauci TaxID=1475485 RepID=A0ABY6Z673_9BACL|nr:DUF58 domain-containing protein [Alicyclobacillus dauci]WAH38370.1 DUF58 domain-containing protein [Alicyclobacillus dauci]
MLVVLWFTMILIAVVWIWPVLWKNGVEGKIDCIVHFPRHECDIGEGVPLTVTLVNRSWFPVPFAEVHVTLPDELSVSPDRHQASLSFATYILMRRRVQIGFTLYGRRRGPAALRDVFVRMHEGLGIRHAYAYDQPVANIAVRPDPKPYNNQQATTPLQGEQLLDRLLFLDETMFKGVRNYQIGDPARHIHWRASARLGRLVSKEFYSSTELDVLLVLNAQTTHPHWAGTIRAPFEQFCDYVTYAAYSYERMGAKLMFASNAVIVGQRGNCTFGRMSVHSIRSLLGHAHPYPAESLTVLLHLLIQRRHAVPPHIVLFSAFETDEQVQLVNRLRRYGKHIDLIRQQESPATPSSTGDNASTSSFENVEVTTH